MEKSCSGLDITPELLGLKDIKIDKITLARDNSIHIKVSSIKKQRLCRTSRGHFHTAIEAYNSYPTVSRTSL